MLKWLGHKHKRTRRFTDIHWGAVTIKIIYRHYGHFCPLDCKEIRSVHPKGNHPWIFIGKTDAEAEAPIFWPPDAKSPLIRKDHDTGKDWKQEEKGTTEAGWLDDIINGPEFEQAPGDGEGQGSLACSSSWGLKELDTTEWLNNNKEEEQCEEKKTLKLKLETL